MRAITRILLAVLVLGSSIAVAADDAVQVPVACEAKLERYADTDSVAVYRQDERTAWLFATEKAGNTVAVFDAVSGALIERLGEEGDGPGQFRRPNGLCVAELPGPDGPAQGLLLVVERDNRRVQGFSLPHRKPVGTFGREQLRKPYGISTCRSGDRLTVYVTDEGAPPTERVRRYRVSLVAGRLVATHERSFGDADGKGLLTKVESVFVDEDLERVYVCDEGSVRNVKVYDLDGKFLGLTFGDGIVKHEAEGLAVHRRGREGEIVLSDQSTSRTYFRVFDRASLKYLGTFVSDIANTDGIWLVQEPLGEWAAGVLYAVHNDRSVRGCAWADIARALRLPE